MDFLHEDERSPKQQFAFCWGGKKRHRGFSSSKDSNTENHRTKDLTGHEWILGKATLYVSFWKQWCWRQVCSLESFRFWVCTQSAEAVPCLPASCRPLPETKQGSQIEFPLSISQFPALMSRCILDQTHLVFPLWWNTHTHTNSPGLFPPQHVRPNLSRSSACFLWTLIICLSLFSHFLFL